MSQKDIQIVEIVQNAPGITATEIAECLNVCDRTVRTYIKHANDCLCGIAKIGCASRCGYELTIHDDVAFSQWLNGAEDMGRRIETPEDRIAFLLNDLLDRTGWVTVDELSGLLYVSRPTVSADLKRVEKHLERFDMYLERKPCYGVRVCGDEMKRRICLADNVVNSLIRSHSEGPVTPPPAARLDLIAKLVDESLEQCDWTINSLTYQNLLVHIAVAIARIKEGNFVPLDDDLLARLKKTRAFEAAGCLAQKVEAAFDIDLPEAETAYIAIHLVGKQNTAPESIDGRNLEEDSIVVTDEVWDAVTSMLSVVWDIYHYDLRDDLELRMNLARHIVPLAVRIRYGMRIENPVLGDIRSRYPLAYAMALDSSTVLAEMYGGPLSEDETGYIALSFALALERQRTVQARKNILIVCATGHGSARMLEHRYRQQFGMYLDHIYTCDASNVERFDFTKVDYVFTTVPLRSKLPVMVREVSFFLDDSDVRSVVNILSADIPHRRTDDLFAARVPTGLFFEHLDARNKAEALDVLCGSMVREAGVDPAIRSLVDRREEFVPTAFGNAVAMPHPLEPVCDTTVASVGLLDSPIDWGGKEVSVVILVAISSEQGPGPARFIGALTDFLVNSHEVENLLSMRSREVFLARLGAISAITA